jgi:hypothetical protein
MKKLIGISAPRNQLSQAAITIMASILNLKHINMRQPMINMLAALQGTDPAILQFDTAPETTAQGLNISLADLELTLAFNLRTLNPAYFIEHAKNQLQIANTGLHSKLFDGQIITGITTELEAQWLRDQGCLVIHIYDYSPQNLIKFHGLNEKDQDLVLVTSNTVPIAESNVYSIIETVRQRFSYQKEAA